VPGNIPALVGRYNDRRHQCRKKDENGGKSYYYEVVDPKSDHFIGGRSRTVASEGRTTMTR
jgi:hypothetical protein